MQKLTDRFAVQVALSDKDVETVVRQVVLRKRPEHVPTLKSALDAVSGEIDKHLGGTQLAPKAADKPDLVPTTRCCRPVGDSGSLHFAPSTGPARRGCSARSSGSCTKPRPVSPISPSVMSLAATSSTRNSHPGMLQSGVVLKEIDELIRGLRTGGEDGELKSRICSLIFLISQIPPRTIGGETGLRATAPFLADLLVEDLATDGARLRKRVPELLDILVADGRLMRIDEEYRLQTEEGAEWEKDYRSRLAAIRDDAARLSTLRSERLVAAVESALGGLKLTHGSSKTPRKVGLHWGQEEPSADEGEVPVWIRDEWSATEASVKQSAAEAGDQSPVVFVFLPKQEADQIKDRLASYAAAEETLRRPTPQTDEGKEAQRAMKTRSAGDDERLTELFAEVGGRARVFMGGVGELTIPSLNRRREGGCGEGAHPPVPEVRHGRQSQLGQGRREGA